MDREIKFKFVVKDNYGNIHISQEHKWTPEDGLPDRETILDNMEKCTCTLTESHSSCECESEFEEGEIIDKLQYIGFPDSDNNDIYEKDVVDVTNGNSAQTWTIGHVVDFNDFSSLAFLQLYSKHIREGDGQPHEMIEKIKIAGNLIDNPELNKETPK